MTDANGAAALNGHTFKQLTPCLVWAGSPSSRLRGAVAVGLSRAYLSFAYPFARSAT